jgi:hypothetical protein
MEAVSDDRQRRSKQERGAGALEGAGEVERHRGWCEAAKQGCDGEGADADQKDASPPEPIGDRAGRQQQRGEAQNIGADDPFDVGEARAEITCDGREHNRDDVGVKHRHRASG